MMTDNNYILWLDDERNPFDENYGWNALIKAVTENKKLEVVWCKNYQAFVTQINNYGLPYYVFFDNDLGEEKEGYDCAKWLIDYCMDNEVSLPYYYVQSMNPVASKNISDLLYRYVKFCIENNRRY